MKVLTILVVVLVSFSAAITQKTPATKKPENIILKVGDGMGTAQVFAGLTANKGTLNLVRCSAIGFQKTQSVNSFVTASGAGATAFAIGKKAKNDAIGVDAQDQSYPGRINFCAENNG